MTSSRTDRRAVLSAAGADAEKGTPCPLCGGTGWRAETHGGADFAEPCSCAAERRRQQRLADASVPLHYADCTLESFKPLKNVSLASAKKIAQSFVKDYPAVTSGLLFIGPPGVGKTHLAVAILKEVIRKTVAPCLFYDYRDILKQIQETYNPASQTSEMSLLEPVLTCPLLVLDELGARRVTDWMHDTMFYILNQRYSNKRITIMTSNFPETKMSLNEVMQTPRHLDEYTLVERIGVRLDSRLHEMCRFVRMEGDDYRKKHIQEQYGSTE
jgi:DNA replication protein DnaC